MNHDHLAYIASHIEEQIADIDREMAESLERDTAASGDRRQQSTILQLDNITLGAIRSSITLQAIEDEKSAIDLAFKDFQLNLQ